MNTRIGTPIGQRPVATLPPPDNDPGPAAAATTPPPHARRDDVDDPSNELEQRAV